MSDTIVFGKIYAPNGGGMNVLALRSPAGDGEVYAIPLSHGGIKPWPVADFLANHAIVNPDAEKPVVVAATPPVVTDIPPASLNVTDTPPAGS